MNIPCFLFLYQSTPPFQGSKGGVLWFHSFIGTIVRVFPSGASIFRTVSIWKFVLPFSILAITGCLTPLSSSSCCCVIPFSCLALMSSPIRATLFQFRSIPCRLRYSSSSSSPLSCKSLYSLSACSISLFGVFWVFFTNVCSNT